MKKVIVPVLSFMLVFGMYACGSSSSDSSDSKVSVKIDASDDLTAEQKNAYESALIYIEASGFSKQALIDQLEHEEYSTEDAKAAIEAIEKNGEVDWNEEAYESAVSYLEYTSLSKDSLIDQLESDSGGQFTHEQAEYGANKAYDEQ